MPNNRRLLRREQRDCNHLWFMRTGDRHVQIYECEKCHKEYIREAGLNAH